MPIPSFAWIFWNDRSGDNIVYPVDRSRALGNGYSDPCLAHNTSANANLNCTMAMEWGTVGPYKAYIFNSSKLPAEQSTSNNLRDGIWLTQYIYCEAFQSSSTPQLTGPNRQLDGECISFHPELRRDVLRSPHELERCVVLWLDRNSLPASLRINICIRTAHIHGRRSPSAIIQPIRRMRRRQEGAFSTEA